MLCHLSEAMQYQKSTYDKIHPICLFNYKYSKCLETSLSSLADEPQVYFLQTDGNVSDTKDVRD